MTAATLARSAPPNIRGHPSTETLGFRSMLASVDEPAWGDARRSRDELEQLEASLDALAGAAALPRGRRRARDRQDQPAGRAARARRARRALVLGGSAAEFERDVPVQRLGRRARRLRRPRAISARHPASPATCGGARRRPPRAARAGAAPPTRIADERFRVHRAVSALLSMLSDDQALVLVLDDLHWSDDASTELIAALIRRWARASVLLVAGASPRPGAGAARRPRLAERRRHDAGRWPADEAEAAELLDGVDPAHCAAIYATAAATRSSWSSWRAREPRPARRRRAATWRGRGRRPRVAASLADELGVALRPQPGALLDAAAVAGEPFEPGVAAARSPSSTTATALAALDELLGLDLVRPTRCRGASSSATRWCAAPSTSRRAAAGGCGRTRARPTSSRRRARARPSARTTSSSRPGRATRRRSRCCSRPAPRRRSARPAAAARWFEAALRLLPDRRRERQVDVRVALASAQRSLGELERCRDTLLAAIELRARRRRSPGGIEVTARCAAVEHWLGQHDAAHRRLVRAWEELPDHESAGGRRGADRARGRRHVRDGLRADAGQRARRARDRARASATRALIAAAASALALGEAASGRSADAREHRDEAAARIERLSDAELAPRLEALYYLGWAENYIERYDDAIAHASAASRSPARPGTGACSSR